MKEWEAFKLARETNAKIRRSCWPDGSYIHQVDDKFVSNDLELTFHVNPADDWEVYKDPSKTFGPDRAMYWLGKGRLVRREACGKDKHIRRRAMDPTTIEWNNGVGVSFNDWFHDDWHLCDVYGNYVPEPEDAHTKLKARLEREEMCHAACGVIAKSDTKESLDRCRDMHPEYLSASVKDCIRMMEKLIKSREHVTSLIETRKILEEEISRLRVSLRR